MRSPKRARKTRAPNHRWKPAFLRALARTCNVSAACKAAKVARQAAYEARHADAAFAVDWDDAIETAVEALEAHARKLAFKGNALLIIFLLKAHRPEKYRDHQHTESTVTINQQNNLTLDDMGRLTHAERCARIISILRRDQPQPPLTCEEPPPAT